MSDIPLDDKKIKDYLSKDLKLEKKNFSYEISLFILYKLDYYGIIYFNT